MRLTKRMLIRFAVAAAAMLAFAGGAQAVPISIFNTGVNGVGAVLPDGTLGDAHYSLISLPGGTSTLRVRRASGGYPIPPWVGDNSLSAWIGPNNTTQLDGPAGTYIYRTTFDMTGLDLSTAGLVGRWATDDPGTNILINGISTGITSAGYTSFTNFSINSGFVAGINTLDFYVLNGGGPTGLRVEISGTAQLLPVPGTVFLLGLGLLLAGALRRRGLA